ncbi:hypothetical protein [Wolbachia endosymbiont (group A) of Sicus ferrugineus]|uniref:hypothetical protein n=1 Tax=Wolbachia endosymbiont (group A) of Sicus ferrugineus TaxID=2954056 RepID=UPI0022308720|nr:hypothetical protein [Wolbachia endosymbiont (group A) of Sicus ferrugineus]
MGELMGNKKLIVCIRCSYEVNRLAELYLLDAYEKLVLSKPIKVSKKEENSECNTNSHYWSVK